MKRHFGQIILSALVLIAFTNVTFAQNIKNEKIDVKYLQLPYTPLPSEIKNYRKVIEIISPSLFDSRHTMTRDIAQSLTLYGNQYKEVESGADLEITARLDPFVSDGNSITSQEMSETKSDKTVRKYTVYTGTSNVAYPLFLKIKDLKQDKVIYEGFVQNSSEFRTISTGQKSDYETARKELNNVIADKKSAMYQSNITKLSVLVVNNFSFYPLKRRWFINYVETSKKGNYDDVMAAKDATMNALLTLSDQSAEISDESKGLISEAIRKWEIILKESDTENRKARIDKKVTGAILENIAFCYFFMNDFTQAEKYIREGTERNRQLWQEELQEMVRDVKRRLEANSIKFQ